MKAEKISLMIDGICKELGIEYCSSNPHYQSMRDDAIKLGCIYQDLKIMIGDLQIIEERHGINGIKSKIEELIRDLDSIDHDIIYLAKQFMEKENDN